MRQRTRVSLSHYM